MILEQIKTDAAFEIYGKFYFELTDSEKANLVDVIAYDYARSQLQILKRNTIPNPIVNESEKPSQP